MYSSILNLRIIYIFFFLSAITITIDKNFDVLDSEAATLTCTLSNLASQGKTISWENGGTLIVADSSKYTINPSKSGDDGQISQLIISQAKLGELKTMDKSFTCSAKFDSGDLESSPATLQIFGMLTYN